jgi:lipopolysaccharide/colanic/teichoic acid biosynthesis glycosyltransferase
MTLKRAFDLSASIFGLLMLLPLLALIALAVRLSSLGPALFRQNRVGCGGRDFVLLKFRTMTVCAGAEAGSFDAGDRSRVTRIGRWLRATKLDEGAIERGAVLVGGSTALAGCSNRRRGRPPRARLPR